MSLSTLRDALQSGAWSPPQRQFLEQLLSTVLPATLVAGAGVDITQDTGTGTLTFSAQAEARTVVFQYDISGDETTVITTGAAKRTWRLPIPLLLQGVYSSVSDASDSGAVVADVNADGLSVFGTNKLSIDAGEEWSGTAATAADLSAVAYPVGTELTFDVDSAGTNARGLKVYLVGVYAIEPEERITESSETRLTEAGETRITEL